MFRVSKGLAQFVCSVFLLIAPASAHDPIPYLNACPTATSSSSKFAPLPEFIQGTIESPVTTWPEVGAYDFCAYMDTLYCQLNPIVGLVPEILDIATLTRCVDGDFNGPLDMEADIPHTPNGILDGQYELGILAAVLNDPTHPLHEEAHIAIQNNFIYFKNLIQTSLSDQGYLGLMPLMAPYFIGSFSMTLAGYATLGDPATYEAIDALLPLYELFGTTPDPDGSAPDATPVPETGPDGDIDDDSFTNREEYDILFGCDGPAYVAAALDPEQPSLIVSPLDDYSISGYEGGPFTPPSITYTINNPFDITINWTAAITQPWVTVSPENGSIVSSGSDEVTVSINANADTMLPGSFTDILTITPDTYSPIVRNISLSVLSTPGEIAINDSIPPNEDNNMPFGNAIINTSYTENVVVTNLDDTNNLIIDSIALESVLLSQAATGFTLNNLPELPLTLTPLNAIQFDVVFESSETGLHEDAIIIESNDSDEAQAAIALSSLCIVDVLDVLPDEPFESSGSTGGPFSPETKIYTLINMGDTTLNWTASTEAEWLIIEPSSGALAADGSAEVTVSLAANADDLLPGVYHAAMTFTNTDTGGIRTRTATLDIEIPLCYALDNCNFTWVQGGDAPWFGQTATTLDGEAAGESGDISDDEESWIETTTNMSGTLSFWWKVSSEYCCDYLEFYINDEMQERITGSTEWEQMSYYVEAGTTLRWRYTKNNVASSGYDCGWVDMVAFIPDDNLLVEPYDAFTSSGYEGGPFSPKSQTYILSNKSEEPLSWSITTSEDWITTSTPSGTLVSGGTSYIIVSVTPESLAPGDYAGEIIFNNLTDNLTQSRDVQVSVIPIPGEIEVMDSILPEDDYDMPFGTYVVGVSHTEHITISNTDPTYDLIISQIRFADTIYVNHFYIQDFPALPLIVEPSGSYTLDVVYAPLTEGYHENAVIIENNDMETPEVAVSLSGNATPEALQVYPDSDFLVKGYEGGPFTPIEKIYGAHNSGATPLLWDSMAPEWLTITPPPPVMLGPGDDMDIRVQVNETANMLAAGHYKDNLTFMNVSTGYALYRNTDLYVVSSSEDALVTDTIPPVKDRFVPFEDTAIGDSQMELITVHNINAAESLYIEDVTLGEHTVLRRF